MTDYQYAWVIYLTGAVACSLATWLLFRRAGRPWVHFFVITVMVILFTPYAVNAESMTMAPAIYTLVFGYFDNGFAAIKPVVKLMLGFWIGSLILSLLYQLLTRRKTYASAGQEHRRGSARTTYTRESNGGYSHSPSVRRTASTRDLSLEERLARDQLLHEEPIRAVR